MRPDESIQLATGAAGLITTLTALSTHTPYGTFGANFWASHRTELLSLSVFGVLSLLVIGGVALHLVQHDDEDAYAYRMNKEMLEEELEKIQDRRRAEFYLELEKMRRKRKKKTIVRRQRALSYFRE